MEANTVAIVAAVAAVIAALASIASAVVGPRMSFKIAQRTHVNQARADWLKTLRTELAQLLAVTSRIAIGDAESVEGQFPEMQLHSTSVSLLLDAQNKDHRELGRGLGELAQCVMALPNADGDDLDVEPLRAALSFVVAHAQKLVAAEQAKIAAFAD